MYSVHGEKDLRAISESSIHTSKCDWAIHVKIHSDFICNYLWKACGPQGYQCTGLSLCCFKYGDNSFPRRFSPASAPPPLIVRNENLKTRGNFNNMVWNQRFQPFIEIKFLYYNRYKFQCDFYLYITMFDFIAFCRKGLERYINSFEHLTSDFTEYNITTIFLLWFKNYCFSFNLIYIVSFLAIFKG